MTKKIRRKLAERKARWRRIGRRRKPELRDRPVFAAGEIRYDLSDRTRAVGCGELGAVLLMFRRLGLAERLDDRLQLLKRHMPYHESDHVLNLICNILAGGTNLEDLELLRGNEDHLKALGADRIPDPTTAGDFLRRFREPDIRALADVFDEIRLRVWKKQTRAFFEHAIIDADGSFVPTSGDCKRGIDMSYDGQWCYHALLLSLANTAEPLCIVNRPGNRPSHEGVDDCFDRAISLVRKAGFAKVSLRGDTELVRFAMGRCDQENLIAQLKNGVNALRAPSNTLESNWAYMAIASGAWCAKAWFALLNPHSGTKAEWLRMEFRTFLASVLSMPCQILTRAKLLIYRLLSWNPWTEAFLRGAEAIRGLYLK